MVALVHFISFPMAPMTSHGLTSEINIYLTAIQLQLILGFITDFPKQIKLPDAEG